MRRFLKHALVIIFPYLFVLCLLSLFYSHKIPRYGTVSVVMLVALAVAYIGAFLDSALVSAANIARERDAASAIADNLYVKTAHAIAYAAIFAIGLLCLITIFTALISLLLVVVDILIIVTSGLIGLSGIINLYRERKIPARKAILHGILQFVFCLDILSAFLLWRKTKPGAPQS